MRIRLAEVADAEAIRTIYNVEVLESTNTFDMVPRTRGEQEAWILEHSGVHPAVVATEASNSGIEGLVGANGEIILGFASRQFGIGQQIQVARDFADMEQLLAIIVVIFVIGVVIDSLFGSLDRVIRRRWGLLGADA